MTEVSQRQTVPEPASKPVSVTIVVITRNRCQELMTTLAHLLSLPERPPVVVVDNGSEDGTAAAVRARFPYVRVVELGENFGAGARNFGVEVATTEYVAFADDDSFWAPGSLSAAARILAANPRVGLINARILVGPEGREDPVCTEMARSPLARDPNVPGIPVLGFVACGAIVRRRAYLACGGFERRMRIGGEEDLLAVDMASQGWDLRYVPEIVAHHHPSSVRDPRARRRDEVRNALWFAWLRRPPATALARTAKVLRAAPKDAITLAALVQAALGLPWVIRRRRVAAPHAEREMRLLDSLRGRAPAG
jgi:GT2 family glycosyltransferase